MYLCKNLDVKEGRGLFFGSILSIYITLFGLYSIVDHAD